VDVTERLATTPDQVGMQPLAGGGWVLHVKSRRADPRALPAATFGTDATIVQ
jgi:hypothetical protein